MHSDLDDEVVLVNADGGRDGLIRRLRLRGDVNGDDGEVDACDRKEKAVVIVGSAGLGKTALARSAYGVLQPQFDCAAFVSVGFHPHIESVLQSLLRQLGFTGDAAATEEPRDDRKLIDQLLGFLQNQRYVEKALTFEDMTSQVAGYYSGSLLYQSITRKQSHSQFQSSYC